MSTEVRARAQDGEPALVDLSGAAWAGQGPTREPVAQRIVMTLEACAAKKRALTSTELVAETGLAKTTVHRMCWKLVELGLLEHSPDGFSIGSKLFALASTNPSITEVRAAAIPYLVELQRRTGAASSVAVLSAGKALILDGLFTSSFQGSPLVGHALPLHCTGVGKAIASLLDAEQREQLLFAVDRLPAATKHTIVRPSVLREHLEGIAQTGVAVANEEYELGVKSVAAGFRIRGGGIGAIGCIDAWNSPRLRNASDAVKSVAADLEQALA
jgi:DNA-binding IclR family transcriptional regulator